LVSDGVDQSVEARGIVLHWQRLRTVVRKDEAIGPGAAWRLCVHCRRGRTPLSVFAEVGMKWRHDAQIPALSGVTFGAINQTVAVNITP
jgi:hypothetical protein